MENFNLDEAKRLIRTGKVPAPLTYEKKLKEAIRGLELDELKQGVEELKEFLYNTKIK
jgi:hypothetical protein